MQKSYDIQHLKKCGGTTNFDFQDFYATACRRTQADSDDRLAQVPSRGCDLHRVIDCGLIGIRERRVADMDPATIGAGEGGGDAREGPQDVADRHPACGHTGLGHACSEDLDRLVGDDGDEEMSIGPAFLVVVDRSETELGLERAEDGFHIREHGVRLPHGFRVPVETIRPQAVDAGLVQHGAFGWVKGPRNRHRPRVCRIRCDGDGIMLRDYGVRLLELSDLALDVGQGLAGPGSGEIGLQIPETLFEPILEVGDQTGLLLFPRLRMTPQENLRVGSRVRLLAVDTVPIDRDLPF